MGPAQASALLGGPQQAGPGRGEGVDSGCSPGQVGPEAASAEAGRKRPGCSFCPRSQRRDPEKAGHQGGDSEPGATHDAF